MIAIGCIIFGAALAYYGYQQTQTVMGGLTKAFSGKYSTEAMAGMAGGAVLVIAGTVMILKKK
jgi:uncharacterized membrane protein